VCGGNLSYIRRRRRRRSLYVGEAYKRRLTCGLRRKHTSDDVSAGYGGSIKATTYMWVTGGSIQATTYLWVTGEAYKPRRVCGLWGKHKSHDVYVGYRGKHTSDDVYVGYEGSIQATTCLRVMGEA
jgi:hypothetical protein